MKFEIKEPGGGKIGTIYTVIEKGTPVHFDAVIQHMKDELGENVTLFDTKPSILLNNIGTRLTCYWRREPHSHDTPKGSYNVIKTVYKPNCYLLVSGQPDGEWVKPVVSFFYDNNGVGVEWCPPYGPIQVWYKAEEGEENVKPHYFYDYVFNTPLSWSQMAAEVLPPGLEDGDWDYIFTVLKEWSR